MKNLHKLLALATVFSLTVSGYAAEASEETGETPDTITEETSSGNEEPEESAEADAAEEAAEEEPAEELAEEPETPVEEPEAPAADDTENETPSAQEQAAEDTEPLSAGEDTLPTETDGMWVTGTAATSTDYPVMETASSDTENVTISVTYGQTEARTMLDMINEFRTGDEAWAWDESNSEKIYYTNLEPLTYDYTLEADAMQRAAEIAVSYSHTRPNGKRFSTAYSASWRAAGENIAAGYNAGFSSAQPVFTAWQETDASYSGQGHRRNMLSSNFTAVGIGYVSFDGHDYWVQEFSDNNGNTTVVTANDAMTEVTVEVLLSEITVNYLSVSPALLTLSVGEAVSFPEVSAKMYMSDTWPSGKAYTACPEVTWTTADSSVASLSGSSITGVQKGTTTLTASALNQTVEVPITVTTDVVTPLVASGTCGAKLIWMLDDAGILTISGTGAMANYDSNDDVPWHSNYSNIKSVIVENGVTTISDYAFYDCGSLTSVTIPEGVTAIGDSAFYGCSSLTSVTIPDGVTTISDYAFYGCDSLTSVTIPEGVTAIGDSAFYGCSSLTGVTIPNGVTAIGDYAFYKCSHLTSVAIPEGVTAIGDSAFCGCSRLISVTISDGVTTIDNWAFACCGVTSVTIPDGVTTIGNYAFYGCDRLANVYYNGTEEQWAAISIGSNNTDLTDAAIYYSSTGPVSLDTCTITLSQSTMTYTGKPLKPTVTVKNGSTILTEGTDYTVGYSGNTDVGTATVIVTGKGGYTGTVSKTFKITAASIADTCTVTMAQTSVTYTGKALTPTVTVKNGSTTLKKGTDYTVSYSNNTNIGTATVTITGKGNYNGTVTKTFTITAIKLANSCTVTLSQSTMTYTGKALKPTVTVKNGSTTLTEGTDYTVSCSNNTNVGTATVKITGKGSYTGTVTKTFKITAASIADTCTVTLAQTAMTYTGKALKPTVTVKNGSTTLTSGTDYTVSYSNNTNVGTATVIVTGMGSYSGTVTLKFTITEPEKTNLSACTVTLAADTLTYTGEALTPTVTVKNGDTVLTENTDYTVAYANNTEVGTATVTVTGMGNYAGTVTKTFEITLGTPTLSAIANANGGLKITWNSVSGASKYAIYRRAWSESKETKLTEVTGTSYTDTTVTAGTTYYYSVRAVKGTATSDASNILSRRYLSVPKITSLKNELSGINVTWSKTKNCSGYNVYRRAYGSNTYAKIAVVKGADNLNYFDKSVTNGKTYVYRIYAYYSSYTSSYESSTIHRLSAPTLSSVTNPTSKAMKITWTKNSAAAGYQVKYVSGSFSKTVTISGSGTTSTTRTNLTKGKTFKVYVRSYKTVNGVKYYSAWSHSKSVTIQK